MDIETLQIKRVTGNWDTGVEYINNAGEKVYGHKSYVPLEGELVMIAVNEFFQFEVSSGFSPSINAKSSPFFIIGDGEHNLEYLLAKKSFKAYLPYQSLVYLRTPSGKLPSNIMKESSPGTSDELSRVDHTHKITKDVINSVVDSSTNLNDKVLRRIYAGTFDPSPEDGSVGDIYIKYEQ